MRFPFSAAPVVVGALLGACTTARHTPEADNGSRVASSQIVDVVLEDNRTYLWNGHTLSAAELQDQIVAESKIHPISEIRLMRNGKDASVANIIDVGQIGNAIGAHTVYQTKDGEFGDVDLKN
jgi:hypothetical protein